MANVVTSADRDGSCPSRLCLSSEQTTFIAQASLVLVMSSSPDAAPDVSPRGDFPGFVRLVGNDRLQLPDRIGNNRIDTIRNVLVDARVALVFLRQGDSRVLNVCGTAEILNDPGLLEDFTINGKAPRSVMEVWVTSAVMCRESAIDAAEFWTPGKRQENDFTSLGEILADQVGGISKEEAEVLVENSYKNKLY